MIDKNYSLILLRGKEHRPYPKYETLRIFHILVDGGNVVELLTGSFLGSYCRL